MNLDLSNVDVDNTGEDKKENTGGGLVGSANTENKTNTAEVTTESVEDLEVNYAPKVVTGTFPVGDIVYDKVVVEYATPYESHMINFKLIGSDNRNYILNVEMLNMKVIEIRYNFNKDEFLEQVKEIVETVWEQIDAEGYNFPLMINKVTTKR